MSDVIVPLRERDVSWVYVFVAGGAICKIGYAVDISLRLRRVQNQRPFGVRFHAAYAVIGEPHSSEVQWIEQRSHLNLKDRRIGDEWFLAEPGAAEEAIRKALTLHRHPIRRFPEAE